MHAYNQVRALSACSDGLHSGSVSFAAAGGNLTRVLERAAAVSAIAQGMRIVSS